MEEHKGKPWIKIIIPIIIIIIIFGIWFIKNTNKNQSDSSVYALDATWDFDLDRILSYGLPVIVDFGADSCIPCKEMAPVLKELNNSLRGKAVVKFVDVWKNSKAANGLPLKTIPSQIFFDKDGKPYVPSQQNSKGFILYSNKDTNEHILTLHEGGMTKIQLLAVLKEMGIE